MDDYESKYQEAIKTLEEGLEDSLQFYKTIKKTANAYTGLTDTYVELKNTKKAEESVSIDIRIISLKPNTTKTNDIRASISPGL